MQESQIRVVNLNVFRSLNSVFVLANIANTDEMPPRSMPFHLGL